MKPEKSVAATIASAIGALRNCEKSQNAEWAQKWEWRLDWIARNILPSGSGIDSGCTIDIDKSTPDCIWIDTAFHHMNDNGFYDGWTEHTLRIRPTFHLGSDIKISGRNRNDIKEYLAETIGYILDEPMTETQWASYLEFCEIN